MHKVLIKILTKIQEEHGNIAVLAGTSRESATVFGADVLLDLSKDWPYPVRLHKSPVAFIRVVGLMIWLARR